MCKKFKKCTKCSKIYCTENEDHVCGEKFCYICRQKHPRDEKCFITPIDKNNKIARIMVFDFEVKFIKIKIFENYDI